MVLFRNIGFAEARRDPCGCAVFNDGSFFICSDHEGSSREIELKNDAERYDGKHFTELPSWKDGSQG